IGWIATLNQDVIRRVGEMKDYTTICCSAPSECLATLALRHRSKLVERNLGIISANLEWLDGFFAAHADRFSWVKPRAGSIAFPRLLAGQVDGFTKMLVQEASILLLPGSVFESEDSHFRIGFGRRSFPDALEQLDGFLNKTR
ncbi:aminotransferase class I/II-fold pyridoxal phosphate-dependent enzyme, partial [Candidatus Bipolaricaulota bacterium]